LRDFAVSDDPAVQAQLDRLAALSLPRGRLSLNPVRALLARLGDPHRALPPTFHVAGTNGKGSTCAFLRAILEADGRAVHVYTSPHLVRFNERIRLAGRLIEDAPLAALLEQVLDAGAGIGASFFEVTTAAAFLAFAREPADACVIEVGMGGRFDATNVLERPVACGIASLGIDHEAFLLAPEEGVPSAPLARIAFEKAGIAKPGVPLVVQSCSQPARDAIAAVADMRGAPTSFQGQAWDIVAAAGGLVYRDGPRAGKGEVLDLPLPSLDGAHQNLNAGLAIGMLRKQRSLTVAPEAIASGLGRAEWPGRLQRLRPGPLTALAPDRTVWLDGGHNPDAGAALARYFARSAPLHLLIGMLAVKDPRAVAAPLAGRLASLTAVPIPGHEVHPPEDFASLAREWSVPFRSASDLKTALAGLPAPGDVLIAGSLYLAGETLRINGQPPE
jgi:dihydrofolate synthase/folylpolyglutamate synthase